MSVFNKQQQDWIKDILTKSRNDITDLSNEIKESALPLIMQHEQNGPGSTDGSNGGIHHLQPSYPTSEMLLDAIRHPQLTSMTDPNGMTILPGATNSNGSALLTLGVAQRIDNSNGGALPPNDSDMRYSNLTNAITNSKNHGDGNGTINTGVGKPAKAQFKCEQCNMIFGSKSAHTSHMKSHKQKVTVNNIPSAPSPQSSSSGDGSLSGSSTSADPYQCDVCKKTFAVPARLVRHYRTHTGERPFECEFCHKMFSVKENLQVHRRIHTKERPYKCDVCGRAFEHSGKLHRHMRIHTGERPHKCTVCNKTFIQSGQLVIHMRTHTGEKPYRCPVEGCGKGFTCSKQLKVHSRTHTGEKPYHCDICFRDFGYNHVLKLHRVQHYGAKCYKCTLCDETFKNKKEMETHIKGHANDLPDDDDDNNTKTTSTNGKVELIETNSTNHQNDLEKATSNLSTLANASSAVAASLLADTPRDTSSSEVTSDGDEFSYFNMYTRYEQALGNSYTTGRSPGLNPALLAAVSIAASANSASSFLNADDLRTNNKSEYETMNLSTNGSTSNDGNHLTQTSPFNYESITLMRQNVCFPPPQVAEFKPSIDSSSDLVKRVEAAIASTEDLMTPPRSGSDSPDRSSTPESDSLMMSDRKISTLPPRKRKLYLQDEGEDKDLLPTIRMNSVIRFAKAS